MGKSGNETSMSIHDTIERRDMTSFQVSAILICLSINMLDGFDVLAIAFTAPAISSDWSLSAGDLGTALSAGLVGMTLGSLFLAPLGDRWGRRPVILGCLIIMSLGMIATGFSRGVPDLSLYRVITGLGIGGMLASLNTIVAEYSSSHRRCRPLETVRSRPVVLVSSLGRNRRKTSPRKRRPRVRGWLVESDFQGFAGRLFSEGLPAQGVVEARSVGAR